ncbi:MAG: ribosomal-processing cysteine protease Prp [Tissierellia bacterium]|nr:ribosomal-processing cysteine protease Prp [Tissierellia bacterium]
MTNVEIFKDNMGNIVRYRVSGHTGFADEGEDIVCSAISILAQTTLVALVEIVDIQEKELNFHIDEKKGILDVKLPKSIDGTTKEKAQILLRTFELGIKMIIESYSGYITLKYREV